MKLVMKLMQEALAHAVNDDRKIMLARTDDGVSIYI